MKIRMTQTIWIGDQVVYPGTIMDIDEKRANEFIRKDVAIEWIEDEPKQTTKKKVKEDGNR